MRAPFGAARGLCRDGLPARPAEAGSASASRQLPQLYRRLCRPLGLGRAPEVQARGAHLIVAKTPRIADDLVDPKVKNFHWGDLTRGLFEAYDAGVDNCILLDRDGFVTEGPGYNVFAVTDGAVATPDRGSLEGITRLSVQELCGDLGIDFAIRPLPAAELREADEDLPGDHGGRHHAGLAARRAHPRQRPAGADLLAAARGVLGEAGSRMARDADRL